MDPVLKQAVIDSLSNVFAQLFEVTADFMVPESNDHDGPLRCARMTISGTFAGSLCLCTSPSLCRKLIASLFPGEIPSDELEQDVVGELLNMVAEGARTLVNQDGGQQQVGVPEECPVPTTQELATNDVLTITELGESISVWLKA